MLLNTPQGPGQLPTESDPTPNVNRGEMEGILKEYFDYRVPLQVSLDAICDMCTVLPF